MVRNINFTKVKTEYDWTTYTTTLENTSGADLESFNIDINFFDAEGVIIGTAFAYHENTWKSGQKVLFEFETDIQDFEKMEWEADYYIAESE
ncbi:FxLYD domain-containing protein [Rossellomorea sp. FM04394]|uniref:FxLYD domain-containing protein n=1 Tax=Rossellomorea sp. FM04394 TaxID=3243076 RepID=UPI0035A58735